MILHCLQKLNYYYVKHLLALKDYLFLKTLENKVRKPTELFFIYFPTVSLLYYLFLFYSRIYLCRADQSRYKIVRPCS